MIAVVKKYLLLLTLAACMLSTAAQAGVADACFNFIQAQDYPRAENTAQSLLQRKYLDRTERYHAWRCLGRAQWAQGRSRDALSAFQQMELLSQTTEEQAFSYRLIGTTYLTLNDLDRAELYAQRAIKGFRELGEKGGEAGALNDLAMVLDKRGDQERALALYQEALSIEPEEARKPFKLNNIATIYVKRGDYEKASTMFRQAIDISRRNGNGHNAAIEQINLGGSLRAAGKYDEAQVELAAGLNAIRLIGDKNWEANGCNYLAELEKARGNKAQAKQWYGKAEALYREIGNTVNADQMRSEAAVLGRYDD